MNFRNLLKKLWELRFLLVCVALYVIFFCTGSILCIFISKKKSGCVRVQNRPKSKNPDPKQEKQRGSRHLTIFDQYMIMCVLLLRSGFRWTGTRTFPPFCHFHEHSSITKTPQCHTAIQHRTLLRTPAMCMT